MSSALNVHKSSSGSAGELLDELLLLPLALEADAATAVPPSLPGLDAALPRELEEDNCDLDLGGDSVLDGDGAATAEGDAGPTSSHFTTLVLLLTLLTWIIPVGGGCGSLALVAADPHRISNFAPGGGPGNIVLPRRGDTLRAVAMAKLCSAVYLRIITSHRNVHTSA